MWDPNGISKELKKEWEAVFAFHAFLRTVISAAFSLPSSFAYSRFAGTDTIRSRFPRCAPDQ
jgi:hypothetical protein